MSHNLFTYPSRLDWLIGRRKIIGASDSPGILGVSPWSSPLRVWTSKTQPPPTEEREETEWQMWGHLHEPTIARVTAERLGVDVLEPPGSGPFHIMVDDEHDFIGASLDRLLKLPGESKPTGVLEMKTTIFGEDWKDEPPLYYVVQLQHQLRVTGLQWGVLAVLVQGSKLLTVRIERNDAFLRKLVVVLKTFWQRVVEQTPPPPSPIDGAVLNRLFPDDNGETVALRPAEFTDPHGQRFMLDPQHLIERKHALMDFANRIGEEIEACNVYLKSLLGNASMGVLPNGEYASWKKQHKDAYEVPAWDGRAFRTHVPKKLKAGLVTLKDIDTIAPAALPLNAALPKEEV